MQFEIRDSRPIWQQLAQQLRERIVKGEYPPGSHFPTVRELAAQAGVNPNTMQRAYAELEQQGLVYTERTSGRFVTGDVERIRTLRRDLSRNQLKACTENLKRMGLTDREIKDLLIRWAEEV